MYATSLYRVHQVSLSRQSDAFFFNSAKRIWLSNVIAAKFRRERKVFNLDDFEARRVGLTLSWLARILVRAKYGPALLSTAPC